ncbi:unnamed protein product, partial [Allacma fusca]
MTVIRVRVLMIMIVQVLVTVRIKMDQVRVAIVGWVMMTYPDLMTRIQMEMVLRDVMLCRIRPSFHFFSGIWNMYCLEQAIVFPI